MTVGTSVMLRWGDKGTQVRCLSGDESEQLVAHCDGRGYRNVRSEGPETYLVSGLQPNTIYYWRIVGKTMANQTAEGKGGNSLLHCANATPTA